MYSAIMTAGALDVVAAVVTRSDGRILVTRRPDDAHLGGMWEFPGGRREPGESHEVALVREMREELDVRVVVGAPLTVVEHSYPARDGRPPRSVRISFYRADIADGTLRALGVQEIAWVTSAELDTLDLPDADRPLIELLQRKS